MDNISVIYRMLKKKIQNGLIVFNKKSKKIFNVELFDHFTINIFDIKSIFIIERNI